MKKYIAIIAAVAALVSCQKETTPVQEADGQTRLISASFASSTTKTTLNEATPEWSVGDRIKLVSADGSCEIIVVEGTDPGTDKAVIVEQDGKKSGLTIRTTLTGTLYAVYPASCCSATAQADDNLSITIPALQDGSFANANICAAKEENGSLAFKNVAAILHFTQTAATNVDKVTVISEGKVEKGENNVYASTASYISGEATVDMSQDAPSAVLADGQSKKIKMVSASVMEDYYIAVAPATLKKGTAFGFDNSQDNKLGGRNLNGDKVVEAGTIYNVGSMDGGSWHDYVEVTDASGNTLKWATMNLNATSAEPGQASFGNLYSWGNTVGQPTNQIRQAFNPSSYSGTAGSKVTKAEMWDVTVNDAARFQWGGTWRLPVVAEFEALANSTTAEKVGDNWSNKVYVNGYNFISEDGTIFFPAAGYCNYTSSLSASGQFGDYWSSSMFNSSDIYGMDINASKINVASHWANYSGRTIRAVSE